ncbi:DUF262 domain-containing protein [Sulfitobacter delicatus]|uniref:GmrSD restriction endonucleases N-terminal domain-containing protein n=1 Tax=Sulfitobacter delicatus TaxID=218672 RepID=A0A1G7H918_9RHOB|nr:DUF262 domain-containing protein [Sulfitobacter delicatus]SDE96927.1 Protein of unknown function DUF262 [Sulfitobacter delicatus]
MTTQTDDEIQTDDSIDEVTETSTVEFNIVVTATDWSLNQLATMFQSEDIIVPDYQRKFVWDIRRASKLIESFAIGLPVPQVFFYENSDGQLEVIDGQQRITSIAYFFEGYFGPPNASGNRKVFGLKGLEQRRELEGMTFEDLDERTRRKLKNTSLRGVTVKQLTPEEEQPESVYHIFERLNTGGQPLNAQEIRNAVYRGPILANLEKLNKNPHWRAIYGKPEPDPKQRDIELILRLFSLFENVEQYSPPMKDFLSREMALNKEFDDERAARFIKSFQRVAKVVNEALEKAFRPRGLLNAATLEAVMGVLLELPKSFTFDSKMYDRLIVDEGFVEAISSNTTSRDQVLSRRHIAQQVLASNE